MDIPSFGETIMKAWESDFFFCGVIGYLAYELFRGVKEKFWVVSNKRISIAKYIFIQVLFGAMVAFFAGIVTTISSANWINAMIYGLLVPTSLSRWFGVGKTKEIDGGDGESISVNDTQLDDANKFGLWFEQFRYAAFGTSISKTHLPYRK